VRLRGYKGGGLGAGTEPTNHELNFLRLLKGPGLKKWDPYLKKRKKLSRKSN